MQMSNEKVLAGILSESGVFLESMRYILKLVENPHIQKDFSKILKEMAEQKGTYAFKVSGRLFSNLTISYPKSEKINNTMPDFKELEKAIHINDIIQNRENVEEFLKIFNEKDIARNQKVSRMEALLNKVVSEKVFLDSHALTNAAIRDEWLNFWKQPFEKQINAWSEERQKLPKIIRVPTDEEQRLFFGTEKYQELLEYYQKQPQIREKDEADKYIFQLISSNSDYQQVLKSLCFNITTLIASLNDNRYIFNQDLFFISVVPLSNENDFIPTLFEDGKKLGVVKFLKKNEMNFSLYSLKKYGFMTLKSEEFPQYLIEEKRRYKRLGKSSPTFFHVNDSLHFYNAENQCLWTIKLDKQTNETLPELIKNSPHLSMDELKIIHKIEPRFMPEYVFYPFDPKLNMWLETIRFEDGFLKINGMENVHIYNTLTNSGLLLAALPTLDILRELPCPTFIWTPERKLYYYHKWEDSLRLVLLKEEHRQHLEKRLQRLPDTATPWSILSVDDSSFFHQYLACEQDSSVIPVIPVSAEEDCTQKLVAKEKTFGIAKFLKEDTMDFSVFSLIKYGFRTLKLEESSQYLIEEGERYKRLGKSSPTFLYIDNYLHFYNENNQCVWAKQLDWNAKKELRNLAKNTLHLSIKELKVINSIESLFMPEYVFHPFNPELQKSLETVLLDANSLKISREENANIYNLLNGCGLLCADLPTLANLRKLPCSTFIWTPERQLFHYNKWEDFLRPVALKEENKYSLERRLKKGDLPDAFNRWCLLSADDSSDFYQFIVDDPEKMLEIKMPIPIKDKSKNLPRLHLPILHLNASDATSKSETQKTSPSGMSSPKKSSAVLKPASPLPKALIVHEGDGKSKTPSPRERYSPLRKSVVLSRESTETVSSNSEKKVTIPEVQISPRNEDMITREPRKQVTHSRSPSPSPSPSSDKKLHKYKMFRESDEKKHTRKKPDATTPSTSVEKSSSPLDSPLNKESPLPEVKLPNDALKKSNTAPSISMRKKTSLSRKKESLHMSDSDQKGDNEKKSPGRETALPVPESYPRRSLSPGRQNRLFKTEDNVTIKRKSDKKPLLELTDEPAESQSPKQDYS